MCLLFYITSDKQDILKYLGFSWHIFMFCVCLIMCTQVLLIHIFNVRYVLLVFCYMS